LTEKEEADQSTVMGDHFHEHDGEAVSGTNGTQTEEDWAVESGV